MTRLVVNFLPRSLSELTFDDLGGLPLLTFSTAPHDELLLFVRRAVELVLALLLLVILSPMLAVIAIAHQARRRRVRCSSGSRAAGCTAGRSPS